MLFITLLSLITAKNFFKDQIVLYSFDDEPFTILQEMIFDYYLTLATEKQAEIQSLKNNTNWNNLEKNNLLTKLLEFTFSEEYKFKFMHLKYILSDFFDIVQKNITETIQSIINQKNISTSTIINTFATIFHDSMKLQIRTLRNKKTNLIKNDMLLYHFRYNRTPFYFEDQNTPFSVQNNFDFYTLFSENINFQSITLEDFLEPDMFIKKLANILSSYDKDKSNIKIYINLNSDVFLFDAIMKKKFYKYEKLRTHISCISGRIFNYDKNVKAEDINFFREKYSIEFIMTSSRTDYFGYFYNFLAQKININEYQFIMLTRELENLQYIIQCFLNKIYSFHPYKSRCLILTSNN